MTEPAASESNPPPVDPAVAAAAAAATDPPAADPAASAEPAAPAPIAADPAEPPAADPAEKPHGNKGRKPWYLDRISEETNARQLAEQRARDAEALLERTTRNPTDPAAQPTPRADETAIETRARQIADERVNGEKIRTVIQAGVAKFDDWDARAEMLGAVGAASPAFVLDVVGVDPINAHLILHALADDPQKAARLAKMDTRTRTIELVKMSLAASQADPAAPAAPAKQATPPKTVSKAPAPPPPVEPGASQAIDWRSDKATDQDFSKGWEANQRERAARGRR